MTTKIKTQADLEHAKQLVSAKLDSLLTELDTYAAELGISTHVLTVADFENPLEGGEVVSCIGTNSNRYIAMALRTAASGAERANDKARDFDANDETFKELACLGRYFSSRSDDVAELIGTCVAAAKTNKMFDAFEEMGCEGEA